MKPKHLLKRFLAYSVLTVGAVFILLPFVWMLLTALKPSNEVLLMPPKWIPSQLRWENFVKAYQAAPFKTYLFNSVAVSAMITAGELITTILAAYAFAAYEFREKRLLFTLLISTMMVPSEILMIPNYITLSELGWVNSYKALVLPWCASVFSIFLLRQRFSTIDVSYYKAARIDGCGHLRFLFLVLVPMARPTLVSIALLKIISSWNAYMWPLIVTNVDHMRTLPIALAAFSTEAGTSYNTLMAFSIMIILPILLVYFIANRQIMGGISDTGVKG